MLLLKFLISTVGFMLIYKYIECWAGIIICECEFFYRFILNTFWSLQELLIFILNVRNKLVADFAAVLFAEFAAESFCGICCGNVLRNLLWKFFAEFAAEMFCGICYGNYLRNLLRNNIRKKIRK